MRSRVRTSTRAGSEAAVLLAALSSPQRSGRRSTEQHSLPTSEPQGLARDVDSDALIDRLLRTVTVDSDALVNRLKEPLDPTALVESAIERIPAMDGDQIAETSRTWLEDDFDEEAEGAHQPIPARDVLTALLITPCGATPEAADDQVTGSAACWRSVDRSVRSSSRSRLRCCAARCTPDHWDWAMVLGKLVAGVIV